MNQTRPLSNECKFMLQMFYSKILISRAARIVIGDSNVASFWSQALNDRKEVREQLTLVQCESLSMLRSALSSVKAHHSHAILSILTNPICGHVKEGSNLKQADLLTSIRKTLTDIMQDYIIPMCKRNPDTKVFG